MDKFVEAYDLPKLTLEDTENLNKPIENKEIGLAIKTLSEKTKTNKQKNKTKRFHS